MENNKIGVVTWHKNGNYGGTLQAYAMSEIYKRMGFTPEFINYNPMYQKANNKLIRKFKDFLIFLAHPSIALSRNKIYKFVRKELSESPDFYDYEKLSDYAESNYRFVSCGSDQVWAILPEKKINEFYFLTFISESRRISYAPSIGLENIPEKAIPEFKKLINGIPFISVREKNGKDIIHNITGREAFVALDPCLLLNKQEWLSKLSNERIVESKYIFCYFLRNQKKYIEFAESLSKKTGYKIISVQTKREGLSAFKQKIVDPLGFIKLIRDAEYVLTDSFHGTVFGITLQKRLGTFFRFKENENLNQNSRINNLLDIIKDNNCIVKDDMDINSFLSNHIDHEKIYLELEKAREHSLLFLKQSIKTIIDNKQNG